MIAHLSHPFDVITDAVIGVPVSPGDMILGKIFVLWVVGIVAVGFILGLSEVVRAAIQSLRRSR